MLRDMRDGDPDAFHRFLWSNHLAYAKTYEVAQRFGAAMIEPSRITLLSDITAQLRARGLDPDCDVRSIFDIGCSLGYLLRHAESEVFHSATTLRGLDIDSYAVDTGNAYLRTLDSRVMLTEADMTEADRVMGEERYDLVLCCGVLMYLDEGRAAGVVKTMLAHARHLVGIICLGHPEVDNSLLTRSDVRESDGAFVHNLERMVREAGGMVISKWQSDRGAESPAYGIVAAPSR
jgi:SAM-dependent methyltransferase